MKKIIISTLALAVASAIGGCDDGSGFTSTQNAQAVTNTQANQSQALRNMAQDSGAEISSPDAVNPPAGEQVGNLVDGNPNSKFLSFSPEATVVFKGVKPTVLKGYAFTSANDAPPRDPKNWTLEGSDDGQTWTSIDAQSDQAFSGRGKQNRYELTGNETAYTYYRFAMVHGGTDEWGGNILQLAEIDFMVVAEAPIVAFDVTNRTPKVGEFVIFKDASLVSPTQWQWTFEGGTPATSSDQHPFVTFDSLGAKTVKLVVSNDKGDSELVQEHFIRVWDPQNPWAGFEAPAVSFIKHLPDHAGQQALERVMPDLEKTIQEVSLGVAKVLYSDVTKSPIFNSVTFETGDYDFPAAKSGTDQDMILMFDVKHLANLEGQSDEAIRDEILGILWHELTHGYNFTPATGQYQAGDELHSYLEGLANYVRIQAGYLEHYRGNIRWIDSWNEDAYNQTSFFLEWVAKTNRNTDFIRQFNQTAKDIKDWSFDAAFKAIFGESRGIDVVFKEYQAHLTQDLGITAPYPTPVEGYRNFAIDAGVTIETNATYIVSAAYGIDEGPSKLIDNHVGKKFNGVIEAPNWFAQYFGELLPLKPVTNVAVTISLPAPQVLQKYGVTTGNDNEARDPTSWQLLGSKDGSSWTLLSSATYPQSPTRLTTYHYDVTNSEAYSHYQFVFENNREGNGRLVQLGELMLLAQ